MFLDSFYIVNKKVSKKRPETDSRSSFYGLYPLFLPLYDNSEQTPVYIPAKDIAHKIKNRIKSTTGATFTPTNSITESIQFILNPFCYCILIQSSEKAKIDRSLVVAKNRQWPHSRARILTPYFPSNYEPHLR